MDVTEAELLEVARDENVGVAEEMENLIVGKRPVLTRGAERDIGSIRRKLRASASGHIDRAAIQVKGREDERIPDSDIQAFRKDLGYALTEIRQDRELAEFQEQERRTAASVKREPGPYDAGSPASWVRDVLASRGQQIRQDRTPGCEMTPEAINKRLRKHGEDVRYAVRKGSKFGQRAAAIVRENFRCEDEQQHRRVVSEWCGEKRAFGTDGGVSITAPGEASAFVPPAVVLKAWSTYRTPYASFAGQCKAEDLPTWGMSVYVPHVTGEMEVTSQTEGSAVGEKAPTAGLIKGKVVNKAGQLEVAQQFLDRAGPGISGDQVLFGQLKGQIDTEIDSYALNQALTEAQSVTNSTATFAFSEKEGVGGFIGDVRKGKNLVAVTAGTRLKATHLFAPSKFVNYIEAYATSTGGPVWSPELDDNRLPIRSEGDPYGEGYSGSVLSQLAIFADDNIPNLGTGNFYQVLVSRPETVLLFRSPPVFYVTPETYSNTLDAALGARVYTACVPRWPEGTAALSGAFYKSSTFA